MKNIPTVILVLLMSGCSVQPELELPAILLNTNIEPPEPAIYVGGIDTSNYLLPDVEMVIEDAPVPVENLPWRCVVMDLRGPSALEVLGNAEFVFWLEGVHEAWTPINGKPQQYFIFRLQSPAEKAALQSSLSTAQGPAPPRVIGSH